MDNQEYDDKSSQIMQLAQLPPDKLIDYLSMLRKGVETTAPNLTPHIQSATVNAINFLNNKLPNSGNELVQDQKIEPSSTDKRAWLDLHHTVSNPLTVLDKINDGTLNHNHIQALQAIYPDLHQEMNQKIAEHLGRAGLKNEQIPYKKRVSMGLLMGQPVDSTMTLPNMNAIIMANAPKNQAQPAGKPKKVSKSTSDTMEKTSNLYALPDQARAAERLNG
jgi:hypothetical protein